MDIFIDISDEEDNLEKNLIGIFLLLQLEIFIFNYFFKQKNPSLT